jgi:MFS-type transporter involved in bile tolerance (Atg22 family)
MTFRSIAWIIFTVAGAILSAGVSLHAFYAAMRVDWRQDTMLTAAYCLLPMLCFPVFFLVRHAQRRTLVLGLLICGFLTAYFALSRRTCAELGYCGSAVSTVMLTAKTRTTIAFLAVAAISLVQSALGERPPSKESA